MLIRTKLYFLYFGLKKFVNISTPMWTPFIRAIEAPKKIIQINKKIANSPAHGKAEFNRYLKITCAKVITIITR